MKFDKSNVRLKMLATIWFTSHCMFLFQLFKNVQFRIRKAVFGKILGVTTYEILHTGRKYFTILLISITHSQLSGRPYRIFIAKLLMLYTPFYSAEDNQQRSVTCKFNFKATEVPITCRNRNSTCNKTVESKKRF